MKKIFITAIIMAMVLGVSFQAQAALQNLGTDNVGYRLIYDTDLDITWYDYTSSRNTWDNQMAWADALSVNFGGNVYDDWRLPTTTDTGTAGCQSTFSGTDCGWNVDTSTGEMAHLWYDELGNLGYYDTSGYPQQSGWGLTNTGPFQNLLAHLYWSGTEYAPNTTEAFAFDTIDGFQGNYYKYDYYTAIAVRPGLAVVPEPISSTLFIVGGATLGFSRFRKKSRK